MSAYRSLATIDKSKDIKYGLIIVPKTHKCNPPSFLERVLYRIIGKKITTRSLFRCSCGVVYRLIKEPQNLIHIWTDVHIEAWIKNGGQE